MTAIASESALTNLVRIRRKQLHLSLAALAAASVDPQSGADLTSSWFHRLETAKPVIPPQVPQLRAMAAGLQLPLPRVQEAAAAQFFGMGGDAPISAETLALAARLQQLSPARREALNGFLDAFSPLPAGPAHG